MEDTNIVDQDCAEGQGPGRSANTGQLVERLVVGWLKGWLVGWLKGWLVGWLNGWLVG